MQKETQAMNKKSRNSFFLVTAAFIWGLAFVAQSKGGKFVGAYTFNCLRNFIGSLILIPIMFVFDKINISKAPSTSTEKKNLLLGGILCGTTLFIASTLQQIGINMGTAAGKAGFLTTCYIILVPVLGIFLKKKCPVNVWIAVIITFLGLYLLCYKANDKSFFSITLPDLLLLLCALSFAVQILFVDYFAPIADNIRLASLQFLVCGILSSVPMLFVDMGIKSNSINGLGSWLTSLSTADAWIPILYAGICSSGIAYTLQVFGQKDLNPTIASLLMSLESVFSVLGGFIILKEKLTLRELLGCGVIFMAVILSQLPENMLTKKQCNG